MRTSLRRLPILLLAFAAVSLISISGGKSALAYTPSWSAISDTDLCLYTSSGYPASSTFDIHCTEAAADLVANAAADRSTAILWPETMTVDAPTVDLNLTATGGSTTTFVAAEALTPGDLVDRTLLIKTAGGADPEGEMSQITGNTADTITVDPAFSAAVQNGDTGQVVHNDYLFYYPGGLVTYYPPGAKVFGDQDLDPVDTKPDVPVGAIVGRQYTNIALGIANGPPTSKIDVDFFFFNGTTDTTNTIEPLLQAESPAGGEALLETMRDDDNSDGLPNHVDKYPSFLNKMFDPDYAGDINGDGDLLDNVDENNIVAVEGQSTGGNDATHLNDTSETFAVDELMYLTIEITGGLGEGQVRQVARNTDTQVTVDSPWTTIPDDTSTYEIGRQPSRDLNGDGDATDTGIPENGATAPIRPLARVTGSAIVSNMSVLLQFVIFEPGAFASFPPQHNLYDAGANSALGYPVVIVLNDPTVEGAPSSISDFCSPLFAQGIFYGVSRDNPCTGITCPNSNTTCSTLIDNCQMRNYCINTPNASGADANDDGTIGTGEECPGWSPEHGDPDADDACDDDNNEAACDTYNNPPAGQAYHSAYLMARRDSDGDGTEGDVDQCALHDDGTFNPRAAVPNDGDIDGDGLPNFCDTPGINYNDNQDGDYGGDPDRLAPWDNRQDNCPTQSNPNQREQELRDPLITVVPLGGPKNDGVGDHCEPGANDFVANGVWYVTFSVTAKCIGDADPVGDTDDTDDDNDGFCDATETALGSATDDDTKTPEHSSLVFPFPAANAGAGGTVAPAANGQAENDPTNTCDGVPNSCGTKDCLNTEDDDADGIANDGCPIQGQYLGYPLQVCNDGKDNDGDTKVDGADSGCADWDPDGDAYGAGDEERMGTGASDPCGKDGWPSDNFAGGASFNRVNLQDVTSFVAPPPKKLDTVKGVDPAYVERWNLFNGAGSVDEINLQDITAIVTGARDKPPMLGGTTRAFDGPVCPPGFP